MTVVEEIRCSNCGAPLQFNPGEIISTCPYCGFTQVIETGKAFEFEHSIIVNRFTPAQTEELTRDWMGEGFLKSRDLAKASKILEKNLIYLPFWVISIMANSSYTGIFERITPPVTKDGKIENKYDWLVIARKATDFPVRGDEIPLQGKIQYDFKRIESFAKVLNNEIEREEAIEIARQQIENLHRFLAQKDVDRIIEIKTDFEISNVVYIHTPVWFIVYEYKGKRYNIIMDGGTGTVINGDIPSTKFGLI